MDKVGNLIECPPTIHTDGALITFCGESPGWQECRDKEGFVGGAGRLLAAVCNASAVNFSAANRTNVVKRRPPTDNFGVFYEDPKTRKKPTAELIWWRQLLIAELTKFKPNLVVALGAEALRTLCPDCIGIMKWRGSILESPLIPGLKVIPEVHPAFVMRDHWEYYYLMIRTFKAKVMHESKSKSRVLSEPPTDFIIAPSLQVVSEWLEHITKNPGLQWYLDVETRGDCLTCYGLWVEDRPNQALCIPIQNTTGPAWTPVEEAHIWCLLSLAMAKNPRLCNQNILYDLDYVMDMGCEPSAVEADPMLMMNVAYPEFLKGLDFTTPLYTNHEFYKDEGKTWKKSIPDQRVWIYNCKDMVVTPKVTQGVTKDLKERNLYGVYQKRTNALLGVALEMQRQKLKLNRDWHSTLAHYLASERSARHTDLTKLIGYELNVKSTAEVATLLYEKLRLPVKTKRATGNQTTEENALKELRATYPDISEINLILKERHLRTKESNYINVAFDKLGDDLYLASMPNLGGAKSGRWAFTKSPKWRGSSIQTISKVMRLMYEPPAGSVFWQRDLSQAEVRIVAWLANCKFLLDIFKGTIKIHKIVGGAIFNKMPDEIESDSLEYDTAKSVVHAFDYMMRYKRLAIEANISMKMAQEVLTAYGAKVPEISEWHKSIKAQVLKNGTLTTPMGRTRICYRSRGMLANTGQYSEDHLRDHVSWIPQSIVPDLLNEGMLKLWKECDYVSWHQQGHDSYLCSGPPERTREFCASSKEAANIHFTIQGKDCHIPSEFQWGYLWGAMLKYKDGEDTSCEAWQKRAEAEGYFDEAKIKTKLYSLL